MDQRHDGGRELYEGSLVFNFGVEGEAWNWGEDGFPVYTDLMTNNPDGMTMSNVSYALKNHFGTRYCYPDNIAGVALVSDPGGMQIRMKWNDDENEQDFLRMPPVELTSEESEEQAELLTQVATYTDEMKLKFITGEAALDDASFDAFVAEANNRGLADAVAIEQAALDRYLAK